MISLSDWKKEVKPNRKLWRGDMLPAGAPAACDDFTLFLEGTSDPKRYAKLKDERSVYSVEGSLTFDTTGAVPLRLNGVVDARSWQQTMKRGQGGLVLKYMAIFETVDQHRRTVILNAERYRNAILVAKHEHCWLGTDGRVYLCDREETGLDLFGEAPLPLAAIAPMNGATELLREYEAHERQQSLGDPYSA
jgi:hypothetical protein